MTIGLTLADDEAAAVLRFAASPGRIAFRRPYADAAGRLSEWGRLYACGALRAGTLLWARERWRESDGLSDSIFYFADEPWHADAGWRAARHMPERASRFTLYLWKDAVCEPLQSITEDEAAEEGVALADYRRRWDRRWAARGAWRGWAADPQAVAIRAGIRACNVDVARLHARVHGLWSALMDAGAFQAGVYANLGTWLGREGYAVAAPEFLTKGQAHDAIGKLTRWLERVAEKERAGQ